MKEIKINLEKTVNSTELIKSLGFISEEIVDFELKDNTIAVRLSNEADEESIYEKIKLYIGKFVVSEQDEIVCSVDNPTRDYRVKRYEDIADIHYFGHGNIALNGTAKFLFDYFDGIFEKIAQGFGAKTKIYPALLPIESYKKTGYLKRSPQYAMFCCNTFEDMDKLEDLQQSIQEGRTQSVLKQPRFALSPSACFHTYIEYENAELPSESVFTFRQNVFRNEGRFNFSEMGRLMDYHVREVVMIGDEKYVSRVRQEFLDIVIDRMKNWGLSFTVIVAADPFVLPRFQKLKKIQKVEKSKYEIKLNCEPDHKISVASFNLHGTAFSDPFNISVRQSAQTVTGCIGFGLERWVIAFICQYGTDPSKWPQDIRDAYIMVNRSK